ncbi:MAG: GUN4 domain-containing protein, partial [Coleofasciculaceae cyanobacterium]
EQRLAARQFREADELTRQAFAQVVAGTSSWSEVETAIAQFSCQDLRHINRFWQDASNGKFGIMGQAELWHQLKANPNQATSLAAYQTFTEQIGWASLGEQPWDYRHRILEELTFDLSAPRGHLPALGVWGVGRWPEGVMGPPPGAPIDIGGWDVVASRATEWWKRAQICQRS